MQSPPSLRTPPSPTLPSPTPPTAPTPWVWTCHRCNQSYPLAATRRCLSCSHRTCLADSSSRHRVRVCQSSYDYSAWREFNEWRRDTALYLGDPAGWRKRALGGVTTQLSTMSRAERRAVREEAQAEMKEKRDKARLKRLQKKTHNCWTDCDFPSHCHAIQYDEQKRIVDGEPRTFSSPSWSWEDDEEDDEEEEDEALTPPSMDADEVAMKTSDSEAGDGAPYESIEEDEWFSNQWSGWEDSSSDGDDTSEDDVTEEERRKELDELAALARMN